jgi:hypothetical protein
VLVSGSGEERARIGNRSANTSIRNRRCRGIRKNTGSSIRVRGTRVHGRTRGLVRK